MHPPPAQGYRRDLQPDFPMAVMPSYQAHASPGSKRKDWSDQLIHAFGTAHQMGESGPADLLRQPAGAGRIEIRTQSITQS